MDAESNLDTTNIKTESTHQSQESKEELMDESIEPDNSQNDDTGNGTESEQNTAEQSDLENDEEPLITYVDPMELYTDPTYAQLFSFFNIFSILLGIKPLTFVRLEKMFCTLRNYEAVQELIDLHICLMRKIYLKSARGDKWEQNLLKFCSVNPTLETEFKRLKRFGYANLSLSSKLNILQVLCDTQFDYNLKFRENLSNTYYAYEIRINPIGTDKKGNLYFYQQDEENQIRVWSSEPGDYAGSSWALRAKSEQELIQLILELETLKIESDEMTDLTSNNEIIDPKGSQGNGPKEVKLLEPKDEEETRISFQNKRYSFWDKSHPGSVINKKKQTRETKVKECQQSLMANKICEVKNEESIEEKLGEEMVIGEETEAELVQFSNERRILPTRNARKNALSNLKILTRSPRKSTPKSNLGYLQSVGSLDEESDDDLDDQELAEGGSGSTSDDEFMLDEEGRPKRVAIPKTRKPPHKSNSKKARVKRKAKGRPPSSVLKPRFNSIKIIPVAVDSSDDDDDENESEKRHKEKKKANEKTLCMVCCTPKRPDLLLLCDGCDEAWHTFCLTPQLWFVPDGDWFCPICEHSSLIKKLTYSLMALRNDIKAQAMEEKRKVAAADRLKREMDYIGISLNNIIPGKKPIVPKYEIRSSSSSLSEENDGVVLDEKMRRSKKKALKRVTKKTRELQKREIAQLYSPSLTVAESRSRRKTTKVDYNFHAYDEQIFEAIDEIQPIPSTYGGTTDEAYARASTSNKRLRKTKLTDLDLKSESETDEYQESSVGEEDPEPDDTEYLPSERMRTGWSGNGRRRKSDDDFIDDDSESDFQPNKRKRHSIRKATKKRKRYGDESESDSSESVDSASLDYQSDSSINRTKSKNRNKQKPSVAKFDESDQEDEEELELLESDGEENEKTETGRPLRRAAKEVKNKILEIAYAFDDDDDDEVTKCKGQKIEQNCESMIGQPPSAPRRRRAIISDEEVFEPDNEEEAYEDDNESMSNVDSAKDSPSTIPVAENDGANTIEPLDLNQDHPESSEDSSQSQREMVKSRNNDVVEETSLQTQEEKSNVSENTDISESKMFIKSVSEKTEAIVMENSEIRAESSKVEEQHTSKLTSNSNDESLQATTITTLTTSSQLSNPNVSNFPSISHQHNVPSVPHTLLYGVGISPINFNVPPTAVGRQHLTTSLPQNHPIPYSSQCMVMSHNLSDQFPHPSIGASQIGFQNLIRSNGQEQLMPEERQYVDPSLGHLLGTSIMNPEDL